MSEDNTASTHVVPKQTDSGTSFTMPELSMASFSDVGAMPRSPASSIASYETAREHISDTEGLDSRSKHITSSNSIGKVGHRRPHSTHDYPDASSASTDETTGNHKLRPRNRSVKEADDDGTRRRRHDRPARKMLAPKHTIERAFLREQQEAAVKIMLAELAVFTQNRRAEARQLRRG